MVSESILNHQQLIRKLNKLCKNKASGTVFLNVEDGNSARLVLNEGVICWVAFKDLRGEPAIDAISEIGAARLKFNAILKLAIGKQQLPSTRVVLERLNTPASSVANEVVPIISDVVSSLSPSDMGEDSPFQRNQVRDVLERESMEYLGPMARLLCRDYLKSLPDNLSLLHIRQVMNALRQDINDEQKGLRFMARVRRALGIL